MYYFERLISTISILNFTQTHTHTHTQTQTQTPFFKNVEIVRKNLGEKKQILI